MEVCSGSFLSPSLSSWRRSRIHINSLTDVWLCRVLVHIVMSSVERERLISAERDTPCGDDRSGLGVFRLFGHRCCRSPGACMGNTDRLSDGTMYIVQAGIARCIEAGGQARASHAYRPGLEAVLRALIFQTQESCSPLVRRGRAPQAAGGVERDRSRRIRATNASTSCSRRRRRARPRPWRWSARTAS